MQPCRLSVRQAGQLRGAKNSSEDTASKRPSSDAWPQVGLHSQWPGSGQPGTPTFDQFLAAARPSIADMAQAESSLMSALLELLERDGPAAIVTHSQPALAGWRLAEERPDLVQASVAIDIGRMIG